MVAPGGGGNSAPAATPRKAPSAVKRSTLLSRSASIGVRVTSRVSTAGQVEAWGSARQALMRPGTRSWQAEAAQADATHSRDSMTCVREAGIT